MIATLVGILGLSYSSGVLLSAISMLLGLILFAYGAANLQTTRYDVKTDIITSKLNPIAIIMCLFAILLLWDSYYYDKNSRDCNIMQAEMVVTYEAMDNSPRTFIEDINVCRNVNPDNTYSDWYIDSIRK